MAVVGQSNMTALLGEAALFMPGCECTTPQSRQAILTALYISGYRLKLMRPPYGETRTAYSTKCQVRRLESVTRVGTL